MTLFSSYHIFIIVFMINNFFNFLVFFYRFLLAPIFVFTKREQYHVPFFSVTSLLHIIYYYYHFAFSSASQF